MMMQGGKENKKRKWCTHGAQLFKRSGFCPFTLLSALLLDPTRSFLCILTCRVHSPSSHTCALLICHGQIIKCQILRSRVYRWPELREAKGHKIRWNLNRSRENARGRWKSQQEYFDHRRLNKMDEDAFF